MIKHWFRKLVLGKRAPLLSEADYKNVILRGNLSMVALTVGVSYIFIDHYNGIYGNEPYYVVTVAISLTSLYLNRIGKYKLASILFVSLLNFVVFLFATSDNYRSGVYIFFVVTGLTAFALFGYRDRRIALFFSVLSLVMFCYSYWGDHPLTPKHEFTEESLMINFTTNFVVAQITSLAIVYFLIDVNFHSEKQILAKNDQLAKANSELDRFVYSASHDLRAPLSSILGLVQIYNLSDSEDEKRSIVLLIRDRVNKMDAFIGEILDYSKNSRLDISQEKVNGNTLITEVIDGLRYSKDFEKIGVEVEPQTDFPIITDPKRLKVILSNLLANSLKYHDPSKSRSQIKIKFKRTNAFWSVTIQDNGIGIKAEHHAKIFDMFYRAHENSEGSGLGLYIVKEVAERMGGMVTVESKYGEGCSFTVAFAENRELMANSPANEARA
jgi:signal transduction histidine kinase